MANLKASKKDIRRIAKRTERNRNKSSTLKTLVKKVRTLEATGASAEELNAAAREYISKLEKACKTNVVHANKVSRHKRALSKHIFAAQAA